MQTANALAIYGSDQDRLSCDVIIGRKSDRLFGWKHQAALILYTKPNSHVEFKLLNKSTHKHDCPESAMLQLRAWSHTMVGNILGMYSLRSLHSISLTAWYQMILRWTIYIPLETTKACIFE